MSTQDAGLAAYQNGDFATAAAEWQERADQGDAQANFNLALLHYNGQGFPVDAVRARAYCQKAAEGGLAAAQEFLGYLLLDANQPTEAAIWFEQAAEQGVADAQFQLAVLYTQGNGVPQDNETAADWYEAAALQNHAVAQFNLGVLYANGKQYSHARHWWSKAAAQDNEDAKAALAKLDEMAL